MKSRGIWMRKGAVNWMVLVGTLLIVVAVILLIWFLLKGETTVDGVDYEDETAVSLSCSVEDKSYEYFAHDDSENKKITVQAVFSGNGIKSIALVYKLVYDGLEEAKHSEAINHAAFNMNLGKAGVSDKLINPNYSYDETGLRLSLYLDENNYNADTAKFFMIHFGNAPKDLATLKRNYENQGFECVTKS